MLRRGAIGLVLAMAGGAADGQAAHAEPACLRAVRTLTANTIPSASDFVAADCPRAPASDGLHYDRQAGAARTVRDIQRDEIVAAAPRFELATVRPGQKIFISARVGPVRVQREVEALQAASDGRRLFVRASDGSVFAVPFPEDVR